MSQDKSSDDDTATSHPKEDESSDLASDRPSDSDFEFESDIFSQASFRKDIEAFVPHGKEAFRRR